MANPENENPYAVLPAPPAQADPDGIPGLDLQGEPSPEDGSPVGPLCNVWTRLGANILDRLVVLGGVVVLGVLAAVVAAVFGGATDAAVVEGRGAEIFVVLVAGLSALGLIGAQAYLLVTTGQTVGKRVLGIRIVDASGKVPSWGKLLIAREGSRYGMGLVPYVGLLLSLADALCIFGRSQQTIHDRVAGTFVVNADGRPSTAAGARGTSGIVLLLVFGLAAVATFGILAAIAIPNFVAMQMKAKRAEVPAKLDGIRAVELAYHELYGQYVAASSEAEAMAQGAGKELRHFPYRGGWTELGWLPGEMVRGVYWVELTPEGFAAYGACDVDGDGEYAVYVATESQDAQLTTPGDVY